MIVNFELFEDISKPYKVGDYALVTILSIKGILYKNLLVKILEIKKDDILIKILNNENFVKDKYLILSYHMSCWSESKEELEILINANKYNI